MASSRYGRASDSIQFDLFEYVYHQILRKDPEWVARDLFRERFRENASRIASATYDNKPSGACCCTRRPRSCSKSWPRGRSRKGSPLEREHRDLFRQDSQWQPADPRCMSPSIAAALAPTRSSPTRSTIAALRVGS